MNVRFCRRYEPFFPPPKDSPAAAAVVLFCCYRWWWSRSCCHSAAQPGMDADGMARLMAREAFDLKNPNKVNATVFGFAGVPTQFHRRDASGYKVVADVIKRLDSLNATTAASLASVFTNWKRVAPAERREAMRAEMQSILEVKGLSADTYEILSKSLA